MITDFSSKFFTGHSEGFSLELTSVQDVDCRDLCWYRASFSTPSTIDISKGGLALDLGSLGKGIISVNGHVLGRFWNIQGDKSHYGCESCTEVEYVGIYSDDRCRSDCEKQSQRYYKLPTEWLSVDKENELVFFDELGIGKPTDISLVIVTMES